MKTTLWFLAAVGCLAVLPLLAARAADQAPDVVGTPTVRIEVVVPPALIPPESTGGFLARLRSWLGIRTLVRIRPEVGTKLVVHASAYASSPLQTDNTPCTTAAGTQVRPGIVATNFLPLGTILEINDQRFIVEDRMNPRFSGYFLDVWFPSTSQALEFGRQKIEITVAGYGVPGQKVTEDTDAISSEQAGDRNILEQTGTRLRLLAEIMTDFLGARLSGDVNRYDVDCLNGANK